MRTSMAGFLAFLLFCLAVGAHSAWAAGTGSIDGTVSDAIGQPLAGAAVIGAMGGALAMRKLNPLLARRVVMVVAWGMTLAYVAKMGL